MYLNRNAASVVAILVLALGLAACATETSYSKADKAALNHLIAKSMTDKK